MGLRTLLVAPGADRDRMQRRIADVLLPTRGDSGNDPDEEHGSDGW
jgi:hypothetical protein